MDKVEYTFERRGSTTGAQSGQLLSWRPGESKVLPKGELNHVDSSHYETRPVTPDSSYETRTYEANGSWKELVEDGETVANVQASPEEAQAWVNGEVSVSDLK